MAIGLFVEHHQGNLRAAVQSCQENYWQPTTKNKTHKKCLMARETTATVLIILIAPQRLRGGWASTKHVLTANPEYEATAISRLNSSPWLLFFRLILLAKFISNLISIPPVPFRHPHLACIFS
jgi:hypothetical protein